MVRSKLRPGYKETHRNFFEVSCPKRITHLRLNMFPDGGIARMRVFGHVELDWARVPAGKLMDMASAVNGAMPVSWSDAHYGRVANLLKPHRAKIMADGWETSRHTHRYRGANVAVVVLLFVLRFPAGSHCLSAAGVRVRCLFASSVLLFWRWTVMAK